MPFLSMFILIIETVFSNVCAAPMPDVTGHVMRWNIDSSTANLNYYIDSSLDSNFTTWAQNGLAQWQGVSGSYLTFTQVSSTSTAKILVKGYSSISNQVVPLQAATQLASDGTLQSCEVQVSLGSDTSGSYSAQYLESGMIHEIGHCLGLQHSLVPDAVMSYFSPSPLTLADDDRFALSVLYPKDGQTQYPMGCATIRNTSGPNPTRSSELGSECVLIFLLVTTAWRLQRKTASKMPRRA